MTLPRQPTRDAGQLRGDGTVGPEAIHPAPHVIHQPARSVRPWTTSKADPRRHRPKPAADDNIIACRPENQSWKERTVFGFVHALHPKQQLAKLGSKGSVGYAAFRRVLDVD